MTRSSWNYTAIVKIAVDSINVAMVQIMLRRRKAMTPRYFPGSVPGAWAIVINILGSRNVWDKP